MTNSSIIEGYKKYGNIIEDLKNGNEVKISRFITCRIFNGKYHVYQNGKLRKSIYRVIDFIQYLDLLNS